MLNYKREGSGKVLVLIHGFLGGIAIFDKIIVPLTQKFDVIAIDLPGHGQSEVGEDKVYTMQRYAEDVVEVLMKENVQSAFWLGHSMGGYITLAALEKKLFPIDKAILLYSSDAADTPEAIEKRTKQQQEIQESGVGSFVDGIIDKFLAPDAKTEDILFAKEVAYEATSDGLIAALGAMTTRTDQRKLVANIEGPMLIIEGEQDLVVKPIETYNRHVQKVKTNTGHLGMLEDSKAVLQAIVAFL
ncbi:alpha/beta hydrolase [Solibacillus sp. R5-41]|uniref:alpha/beta fold hydrolase n=1 Tax=Solibacillus sp. R5-41 TaxID=2048654 RepID=UPI000C124826|nr:alpha/beta hydrolase [Solibacillus sp. R5-41]ATP40398.1 alpha/beta hydrolase [Solibacillus sp. R5-41]